MLLGFGSNAQNHQGFEGYGNSNANLNLDCWNAASFTIQPDATMEGIASFRSGTINNPASPSIARSPWVYFNNAGSLIFKHRPSNLSSSPKLDVSLVNKQTSVSTSILTYTYTSSSVITTSLPITVSGAYRIIFTASGNGGSSRVFIDDIYFPGVDLGDRSNNSAGSCGCVPPVISNVETTPLSYNQGQSPTVITADITLTDAITINIQKAIVNISGNYNGSEDVLAFTNILGISGAWDSGTGTLTLTGPASLADYQTALRTITYNNTNNINASSLNRTISFVVNDGATDSNIASRSITINPYYNLVGSTSEISTHCFTLTPTANNKAGAVWNKTPLDMQYSFELNLDVRLSASGITNDNGADGVVFVLQRDVTPPPSNTAASPTNALGSAGGNLAYGGISPSIGISFDTYQNGGEPAYDFIAISKNGSTGTLLSSRIAAKVDGSNNPLDIEDGTYHSVKVTWEKSSNTFKVFFDGIERISYAEDFINTIFGGNSTNIYWGFTASTGGQNNEQSVCGISLLPINDAPSFVKGADQTINEDDGAQTQSWATAIDDGDPELNQNLSFNIINNSNTGLFSAQPIVDASGNLTYTPAANINGEALIKIALYDNGSTIAPNVNASDTVTFKITVNAVNDAPSFIQGTDQIVNEDDGAQTSSWATLTNDGDPELTQNVFFNIIDNSKTALFSVQPVVDGSGNLIYTPAPNANGEAFIRIALYDNGASIAPNVNASDTVTFKITINAVNDAPSFIQGADQTIDTGDGAQSLPWATLINDGDDDLNQNLLFSIIENSNSTLFTIQPFIDPSGKLIYTPAPNMLGEAIIKVILTDDGSGTAPNINTSSVKIFKIKIEQAEPKIANIPFMISEGFSPNNDNINETWYISGIEEFANNKVQIFNRWGIIVYQAKGYNNTTVAWSGRANTGMQAGNDLEQGTYYYTLYLGGSNKATLTGYIEIVR